MIQSMQIPEIGQIMILWKKAFCELYGSDKNELADSLQEEYAAIYETSNVYVVKKEDATIVGFAAVVEGGYLDALYIEPKHRLQHLGGDLLRHLIEKYDELVVDIPLVQEQAIDFLLKYQFVKEEISINETTNQEEIAMYRG